MAIKLYGISELTLAHKIYLMNAKCLDINIQACLFLHEENRRNTHSDVLYKWYLSYIQHKSN